MNGSDAEGLHDPHTDAASEWGIEAVLAGLREVQPEDGLERRVLQRLGSAAPVDGGAGWAQWGLRPRFALPAVLALGTLCMVAVFMRHAVPGLYTAGVSRGTVGRRVAAPVPAVASAKPSNVLSGGTLPHAVQAGRGATATVVPVHAPKVVGSSDGSLIARAPEASFPAPVMPLTEQERLLLQIAHRNDPVQVAMLDPVERNLQIARERAESARFFAPPPLPHELQQEIHAALRSQYVNTPPPDDLN